MAIISLVIVIIISCIIGSMTGIGGGIIIKPILDFLGFFEVKEISLYSSLALIGMSSMNLFLNRSRLKEMAWKIIGTLTLGAIIGGAVGHRVLMLLLRLLRQDDIVVIIQSGLLILLLSLTLFLMKKQFSMQLTFHGLLLITIGFILGFFAAMLSIGGGPINVAILLFIFGFPMNISALYSIMMIFFSQLSGFVTVSVTSGFAVYDLATLAIVFATGIAGGFIGSKASNLLSNEVTNRVFAFVLLGVICLNVINILKVM